MTQTMIGGARIMAVEGAAGRTCAVRRYRPLGRAGRQSFLPKQGQMSPSTVSR